MAPATVSDFEKNERETNPRTVDVLKRIFERAGVEFLQSDHPDATAVPEKITLTDGCVVQLRSS